MVWRAQQFAGLPFAVEVRTGQPVIQGRNVRAATIAELIAAGEDPGDVADWYELTEQEVAQAVGYTAALPRVA